MPAPEGESPDRVDALVVGAGPAGLTAALELSRRGHSVRVVDAADRIGGMAGSRLVAGIRVDLGSHRLHPVASPRVEALLGELLGDDLQVRERNGRLRLGGRWVRFPLRATDLARSLPPRFVAAAMRDAITGPIRRRGGSGVGDETFADVVRHGLGPALLDDFYGPYARKLWGVPADQLAGELAHRRIAASSPGRLLAKVARAARREPIVFRYPTHGYGQVVDRLAAACHAAGAVIDTGVSVTAIERIDPSDGDGDGGDADGRVAGNGDADGAVASNRVECSDGSSTRCARVFWSAPPRPLVDLLPGGPDVELRHRGMVLVYLVYDGDRVTPFDAHYLPGDESIATRISEPANYRDGPDPHDRTVLCAEIPCDVGDDVWTSEPTALGDRLAGDLDRLGITDRRPVGIEIERLPHVYPVITPSDLEAVHRLQVWTRSLRAVTVFGRQGLFVADNLHHVMDMGFAAADCFSNDGGWDQPAWLAALDRFATHVVED